MKKIFNIRIIPLALLFLVLGIFAVLNEIALYTLISLFAVSAFLCFIPKINKKFAFKALIFALIFFLVGITTMSIFVSQNKAREISFQNALISGVVEIETAHEPSGELSDKKSYNKYNIYLSTAKILDLDTGDVQEIDGKVLVVTDELPKMSVGFEFSARGSLVTNEFSAYKWKKTQYYEFNAVENASVKEKDPSFFAKLKINARETLHKFTNADTADFIYAMIFGDSAYMEFDIKNDFQKIGAAHIFAVSGLHVAIFGGAVLLLLKKLKINRCLRSGVAISTCLVYAAICDFTPSVTRAVIMFSVWQLSQITGRRSDGITSICFAGIAILLFKPFYILETSFQLSFLAVFGIAMLGTPLKKAILRNSQSKIRKKFADLLSVNLSANIGMLPLSAYYFLRFSLISIPANFVIVPIISIFFPLMIIAVLISSLVTQLGFLTSGLALIFTGIREFSSVVARIPFAVSQFNLTPFGIVLYLFFIVLIGKLSLFPKKWKLITSGLVFIAFLANVIFSTAKQVLPTGYGAVQTDKFNGDNYIFIRGESFGNALIINGDVSSYRLSKTVQFLEDNYIGGVDILITESLDGGECSLLASFSADLRFTKLMTRDFSHDLYKFYDGYTDCASIHKGITGASGFSADFLENGRLLLVMGENLILVTDRTPFASDNYDLIIYRGIESDFEFYYAIS